MSASVSIQYLGYLGAAIGVGMVIPQIVRTYSDRALGGVSALSWGLNGLSSFTWLLYGISASEIPQIPGNIFIVSGAFLIALSVPSLVPQSRRAVAIAVSAAVLVALAIVLPAVALGFVGFGIGLVSTLPQTMRSLRRVAGEVSAVSVPTWILFALSQLCWLIYAIVLHDEVVTISASWLLLSSLVISASEVRQRRRELLIEEAAPASSAVSMSVRL